MVKKLRIRESLINESHDIDEAETLADSLIGMPVKDACRELRNSGYDETEYGIVGGGTPKAGAIEYSTYSNPEDDFEIVIRYRLEKGEGNKLLISEIIDAYVLDYRE